MIHGGKRWNLFTLLLGTSYAVAMNHSFASSIIHTVRVSAAILVDSVPFQVKPSQDNTDTALGVPNIEMKLLGAQLHTPIPVWG